MKGLRGLTVFLSLGSWGGVYFVRGFGWRLCLGFVAVTILPCDDADILDPAFGRQWFAVKGREVRR